NAQYAIGYSKGNTGGSNEATTAGNNARAITDFDYDDGYNNFDVRHTFNLSQLLGDNFGAKRQRPGIAPGRVFHGCAAAPVTAGAQHADAVTSPGAGRQHPVFFSSRSASRRTTSTCVSA